MKSLKEKSVKKMGFIKNTTIDIVFGICLVLLGFGVFPSDYQHNAPTMFVLFSLIVYRLGKMLSRFTIKTIESKVDGGNKFFDYLRFVPITLIFLIMYITA